MKGLLIKDFKLIKVQRSFFLIILAIAVGITFLGDDSLFSLGFLTFVGSLFAANTLGYDEMDHGNAFLFSLPITRTIYVREKYLLGLLLTFGCFALSTALALAGNYTKETPLPVKEILLYGAAVLIMTLLLLSLVLPFQLKFGGEKGRIAVICAMGLLFAVGVVYVKASQLFKLDTSGIVRFISSIDPAVLLGTVLIFAVLLFLFSMKISESILRKKEF